MDLEFKCEDCKISMFLSSTGQNIVIGDFNIVGNKVLRYLVTFVTKFRINKKINPKKIIQHV